MLQHEYLDCAKSNMKLFFLENHILVLLKRKVVHLEKKTFSVKSQRAVLSLILAQGSRL